MANDPAPLPPTPFSPRRRGKTISPWWSLAFLLVLSTVYSFRTDATYAITVWPAWFGAIIGIVLVLLSKRSRLQFFFPWILFVFLYADEGKSFHRMLLPEPAHDLRVVSLNCAGGSYAAAEEVKAQNPDIVFFQESCDKGQLQKLAKLFFGDEGTYISGPDASIVARGKLIRLETAKFINDFVAAEWTDVNGRKLNVVSLRLLPPTMRIDLFDKSAWNDFATNRSARRKEVLAISAELNRLNFRPDILGGDFNTPPDIDVLEPITIGMKDTFAKVGVGYGATCVNPYPCLVRIDQIHCSKNVTPTRARVVATQNSDHRMLVSDFTRNP